VFRRFLTGPKCELDQIFTEFEVFFGFAFRLQCRPKYITFFPNTGFHSAGILISAGKMSTIYKVNTESKPYTIVDFITIKDKKNILNPPFPHLINHDKSANLHLQEIAIDNQQNFSYCSRGYK
jgi:hypothetical protein